MSSFEERLKRYNERHGESSTSPAKSGTSFEDRLARYNERNGIETNPVSSATPETPQPKVNLEPNEYTTREAYTDTGSRNYSREDILRMLADAKVAQEQEKAQAQTNANRMSAIKPSAGGVEAYTDTASSRTSREDIIRRQGVNEIVAEKSRRDTAAARRYANMELDDIKAEWSEKEQDYKNANALLISNVPFYDDEPYREAAPGERADYQKWRDYFAEKLDLPLDDKEAYEKGLKKFLDDYGPNGVAYTDSNGSAVTYANLYYTLDNERKLKQLAGDTKLNRVYEETEEMKRDLNKVRRYVVRARDGEDDISKADKDAILDLAKKYGIEAVNAKSAAMQLLKLQDKIDENAGVLNEAGYDYARISEYTKRQRQAEEEAKRAAKNAKWAEEHPFLATLATVIDFPLNILGGIGSMASGKGSATPEGAGEYVPINPYVNAAGRFNEAVTGAIAEKFAKDIKNFTGSDTLAWLVKNGYTGLTSFAQSAVVYTGLNALFGPVGAKAALGILGTQAGISSMEDAARRGASNGDAIMFGIASGIFETLFEEISLDRFVNLHGAGSKASLAQKIKTGLYNTVTQGGVEASEEVFTAIADEIADRVINANLSQFNTNVRKYVNQGMSEEKAKKQATLDFAEEVASNAFGGFIGGGIGTAGKMFGSAIIDRANEAKQIRDAVRGIDADKSVVRKIANGKELTTDEAKLVIVDPTTSAAVQELTGMNFAGMTLKNGQYADTYTPAQVQNALTRWYESGATPVEQTESSNYPRISLNNSLEQNLTALAQTPTTAETSEISPISPAENTSEGNFTSDEINARNAEITSDKQGSWNKIADSFGENGREAMKAAYDATLNEGELGDLAAAFAKYYEAGRNESSLLDVPARISATVVDAFGDPNEASAFIQSAVQAGAADRALTIDAESDTIVSQEIEGGNNNGRQESGVRVRGGSVRGDVQSTRGQTREVRGEQAQNQGGRTGDVGRGTSGEIGQNVRAVQKGTVGEKVSPKQLGIRSGSDASNVVMKAGDYAIREAAKLGIGVTAVKGAMRMKDGYVDGVSYRDSRTGRRGIVYQGDSKLWTEKQFIRHEGMHVRIAQGKVSMNAISDAIKRLNKTDADVRTLFDAYLAKYGDIYDDSVLLEEIFCDAYAAMDRFGVEGARKAMDTIRREFGKAYEASRSAESEQAEESVTESYERYSINAKTYEYAKNVTGVSRQTDVAYNAIRELGAIQKEIGKNIRKDLPQGHWRMNIHNMNEYLAKHTDVWQRLVDIQKTANENGVPVDFVTPVGKPYVIEGKTVEGGLKGFPIEYVTKEDGGYKFNGFARSLSQLFVDRMNDAARWQMQDEFIAAVEDAYKKRESMADPVPELEKMLKTIEKEFNVPGRNIASKTKFSVQTALRSAKKTVMALNLNAACPMFTVGNHGCYLDACYLTQMGAGGNTVNLFQSSIYAGEILQLSQATIDMLNADPDGLRINGVGDTIRGNKGALLKVFEHAAMRGLKLKIITKQIATLEILREAAKQGIDISDITVQLSMDNLWIPAMLDDAWGSGIRGTVGIAQTVRKGNLEAASAAYDAIYGREAKTKDGVLYRKYGFSAEKVNELIKEYPEINILPRYVVTTASEIADLALGNGPLGQGPFIQTLMHGVVPEPCFSDYPGKVLNFGSLRHVVEKNANGEWEFYGARVAKDKQTGAVTVTRKTSSAHAEVDAYIKNNYTPAEQNTIYRNLQKQLCCKASEKLDACAGCQSLYGGGCSLCAAMKAKRNQNYAIPEDLVDVAPATSVQAEEGDIKYSRVTDKKTLNFLNNQDTVKVYRAMQLIDGKLYPPMAAKVEGSLVEPSEIGVWEQADERPDLIRKGNKFKLDKANGSAIEAAYNPYFHTSRSPLNDQFSSAYNRPNLVTVEGEVPVSELTSGYRAEGAKDTVGEMKWHSGPVSSKLAKAGNPRRVILSRWFKPTRIINDSEVAQTIAGMLEGTDISIPANTITPSLRAELEKLGVDVYGAEETTNSTARYSRTDAEYLRLAEDPEANKAELQRMVNEAAKEAGYESPKLYHGTDAFGFTQPRGMLFATDSIETANTYGVRLRGINEEGSNAGTYQLYANTDGMLVLDADGAETNHIALGDIERGFNRSGITKSWHDFATINQIIRYAKENGYTGVVVKNVRDAATPDGRRNLPTATDYVFFNPKEQLKSADPVTYDDNGNVIPLSERFNSESEDIRYSRTDSTGRELSEGQQEYFKDSKVRDDEGRLLTLYSGTGSGGFTTFRNGKIWLTTVYESARAYGGAKEGVIFAPDKNTSLSPSEYSVGKKYTVQTGDESINFIFDSKKDYNEFEKKVGGKFSDYLSEAEYDDLVDEYEFDDKDTSDLERRRELSNRIRREYLRYNREHSRRFTIGYLLNHPEQFSRQDFANAWYALDGNAIIDEDGITPKEDLVNGLIDYYNENREGNEGIDEFFDIPVFARVPENSSATTKTTDDTNTVYELYANLINPYVYDNKGRRLNERESGYYQAIDYAEKNSDKYDGVIIKNVEVGPAGSGVGTTVVAFNSNQVKSVNNLNPTESEDIRYSRIESDPAAFNGKDFWSGSVNLADGIIEEVHSIDEARRAGYHHSFYFSLEQLDKMDNGENAFFWVDDDGTINGEWRDSISDDIIRAIESQITINSDRYSRLTDEMAEIRRRMAEMTDGFKLTERELLTNALETVSDERELGYLESYRGKISQINAAEAELKQLRKDMMSGNLDAAEYKSAQVKANHLDVFIRDADSNIIKRIKASKPIQNLLKREQKKAFKEGREAQKLKEKEREAEKILRDRIKKIAKDFNERLQRPTERRWVPDNLLKGVIDVAEMIDPTGAREGTKVKAKFNSMKQALDSLKVAYDKIADSNDAAATDEFDKEFSAMIGDLAEVIGDTPVRDMSFEQLQDVYAVLNDIRAMVNTANKIIREGETYDIYETGRDIINEQNKIIDNKLNTRGVVGWMRERFVNPMRAALEMSGYNRESQLYKLFEDLDEGRKRGNLFRMSAEKELEATRQTKADKKKYADAVEKPVDFGIKDIYGKPLLITKMQAMQLLMTYYREQANPNRRHLQNHVFFPDVALQAKGKFQDAYDKSRIMPALTPDTLNKLIAGLDEWDKRYLEAAKRVLYEIAPNAINEVTMQTKHRPVATEKYYIPYEIMQDYLAKESENVNFNKAVANMGMLKSVVPNAGQPLVMRGLNAILDKHIGDAAKVYAYSLPVRNFNKVFNMRLTDDEGGTPLKLALRNAWGNKGVNLLDQAVADVQGPRAGDRNALAELLRSGMVVSTLANNVSVWMKQAASYPTAGSILSAKSLTKGLKDYAVKIKDGIHAQDVWDEIDEHTAEHYIRRIGLSTQELGELNQSKGWQNKLNSKLGKMSPMNWIQSMDVATTAALWYACKAEVESNGVSESDPTYWDEVTQLYERVLGETQPMYDPLHRAEVTKEKSWLRNVVMFQTQPLQNSGILRVAGLELKAARKQFGKNSSEVKEASKAFRKAVSSQLASHFTFTAMTLLAAMLMHRMNPYRDDEEGEVTPEAIARGFGKNFGKSLFGAIFPVIGNYATSIAERFTGKNNYDILSDAAADKANDLVNAFRKIKNPTYNNFMTLGTEIASLFGIPAGNARKIIEGGINHVKDIINGEFGSFEAGYERTSKQTYNRLYNAYKTDSDKYKSYYDNAIESGKSEQQIKQAMDDRIKQDKGVDHVADLKPSDRYLSPSQQKAYDAVTRRVKSSEVWAESDSSNRAKLSEIAYDVIAGSKRNTWQSESVTTENDLTQTEYILYKLALDIVDKPNSNGNYGTYTDSEKAAAVKKAKRG